MHFKFCVMIDTEEYKCMHDLLDPKGCVKSHMSSTPIANETLHEFTF